MGMNSLPKTVTGQQRGCNLNSGPSVPESSTLNTRLLNRPICKVALVYQQRHVSVLCKLSHDKGWLMHNFRMANALSDPTNDFWCKGHNTLLYTTSRHSTSLRAGLILILHFYLYRYSSTITAPFPSPYVTRKKVKFSHTGYRALGPELFPVYRQSACRWREVNHAIDLAVGCRYFLPGLRLPP